MTKNKSKNKTKKDLRFFFPRKKGSFLKEKIQNKYWAKKKSGAIYKVCCVYRRGWQLIIVR